MKNAELRRSGDINRCDVFARVPERVVVGVKEELAVPDEAETRCEWLVSHTNPHSYDPHRIPPMGKLKLKSTPSEPPGPEYSE